MDGLAQLFRVAHGVEHIVANLEGQAQGVGVAVAASRWAAEPPAPMTPMVQAATISAPVLRLWISSSPWGVRVLPSPLHIQHLAAHHAQLSGAAGERPHDLHHGLRRGIGAGSSGEGGGQKAVPGQHRLGLAVDLVVGQAAPAVVVVIHARRSSWIRL